MFTDILLMGLNVVIGVGLFFMNICYVYKQGNQCKYSWIKIAQGIAGLYFAGLYLSMIIGLWEPAVLQSDFFRGSIIRPGITMLLSLMLAGAISRYKASKSGGV